MMDTGNRVFVYIDESGTAELDTTKPNVSNHFVIAAVIISEDKHQALKDGVDAIRKKYFQTGEIKSSGVGGDNKRRSKILDAINRLDFSFYALAIDKEKIPIDSPGLKYKRSFFKFTNRKLYDRFFRTFSDLHIIADEHGNEEFKLSFKEYMFKTHKPDMFEHVKFDIVKSHDHILVQLADFVVGTVSKSFEGKVSAELKESYISFMKDKALQIHEWPPKYQDHYPEDPTSPQFERLIHKYALKIANTFIDENETNRELEIRLQVASLTHLVFHNMMISSESYVSTKALKEFLLGSGFGTISVHMIRSKIIAPLRDSNILIASSNKGYKIPSRLADMEEFATKVQSVALPLLQRLARARDNLIFASQGELDILKGANYPHLVKLIDALKEDP